MVTPKLPKRSFAAAAALTLAVCQSGIAQAEGEATPSAVAVPAAAEDAIAEVTSFQGSHVLTNQGAGYTGITPGMTLKAGDTVVAGENSEVRLFFAAAQCEYVVPAQTSYIVTNEAPCAKAAVAEGNAVQGVDTGTHVALAAGVAVVAGVGVVVLVSSSGDDDSGGGKPVSP